MMSLLKKLVLFLLISSCSICSGATVTKSIGTNARDYSTMTLWEDDLDDDPTYDAGDIAIGECYDDSVFDEAFTIDGGSTIGLASRKLTVASSERHDGTAGNGVRIVRTGAGSIIINIVDTTVEWIEIDYNGNDFNEDLQVSEPSITLQRMIVHGGSQAATDTHAISATGWAGTGTSYIHNNIVYNFDNPGTGSAITAGIADSLTNNRDIHIQNNTIVNIKRSNGASGAANGIYIETNNAGDIYRNNICMDMTNGGAGNNNDFGNFDGTGTEATNLSSDTTAPGAGSVVSKASGNQFVSNVEDSEDLHLKSGADAIDVATDLGTTPPGVEIDIDGRDRDAEGDTWDIGAHEFVSGAPAPTRNRAMMLMGKYEPDELNRREQQWQTTNIISDSLLPLALSLLQ